VDNEKIMKNQEQGNAHQATIGDGKQPRTYFMAYSLATLCIHDGAIPLGA